MRNGISPLSKGRGLFHRIGNFVPYTMKPSGGCALRAKEDGCWRQPCSGAENPAEPDSFFVSSFMISYKYLTFHN